MSLKPPCHGADIACQEAYAGIAVPASPALAAGQSARPASPHAVPSPQPASAPPPAPLAMAGAAERARTAFFHAQVRAIMFSGIILLITLTWNSTFEKLFERFIGERDRFIAQLAYALLLTGILFLVLYFITRSSFKAASLDTISKSLPSTAGAAQDFMSASPGATSAAAA